MQRMRGYRTYVVAALALLAVALDAAVGVLNADPQAQVAVVAMAALMAVMRTLTRTPPRQG